MLQADLASRSSAVSSELHGPFQLLQLPETALDLVLQQLDPCSLASTAATCSKLRYAVPANISEVAVRCRTPGTLGSFNVWLEGHSSSLTRLTGCSVLDAQPYGPSYKQLCVARLPCAHLRQLQLNGFQVQLEPTDDCPGVLHDCTGLTALDLESCQLVSQDAALAVVAASADLQHLRLAWLEGTVLGMPFIPEFRHPLQLTHLSIAFDNCMPTPEPYENLDKLSALVNLQHLDLSDIPQGGPVGGWPSQLLKLTCLRISHRNGIVCDVAEQFQHLSCLTALQDFSARCVTLPAHTPFGGLCTVNNLSQLSSLSLAVQTYQLLPRSEFSTALTQGWSCRTVLQRLSLGYCFVQPEALASLTQLQSLSLDGVEFKQDASAEQLLLAVTRLCLLTELSWCQPRFRWSAVMGPAPPAAAFTALTVSTKLCSLRLGWRVPQGAVLFQPGAVYPHLRRIDLCELPAPSVTSINKQQLQVMSSCCPAVESLTFAPSTSLSYAGPTAWSPLLQLSALTKLVVYEVGPAAAAAVGIAAQLTGLRKLKFFWPVALEDAALLQLTDLKALERLELWHSSTGAHVRLVNKARKCDPPDVWIQLLRHLLRNAACRQALLRRSSAAAAAPAELMLAQLAATLAEELAANSRDHDADSLPYANE